MGTPTTNYAWTKPTVSADNNTWGGELNGNLDAQDATMFGIDYNARRAAWRNMIINGAGDLDQRGSVSGFALGSSSPTYGPDRWKAQRVAGATGSPTATIQQGAGGPDIEFVSCVSYQTGAFGAATSAAADQAFIEQDIEGLIFKRALWGTASPRPIRISGEILSSSAGNICVGVQNSARARSYVQQVNVASANAWTPFSLVVPGDTTGTWLSTNGIGMRLIVDCGHGSNYEGTGGAWQAGDVRRIAGSVRLGVSPSQQIALSKIQVEIVTATTDQATEFERRPLQIETIMAQRYYRAVTANARYFAPGAGAIDAHVIFAPPMRAAPAASQRATSVAYTDANVNATTSAYITAPDYAVVSRSTTTNGNCGFSELTAFDADL